MGLEERLRRIEYLERLSERAEKALAYLMVYSTAAPVIQRLTGISLAAFMALVIAAMVFLALLVYRARLEIEEHWGAVLRRDPRILAFPWLGLAAILVALGALLTMLLQH